jgi:hypothetical protein
MLLKILLQPPRPLRLCKRREKGAIALKEAPHKSLLVACGWASACADACRQKLGTEQSRSPRIAIGKFQMLAPTLASTRQQHDAPFAYSHSQPPCLHPNGLH